MIMPAYTVTDYKTITSPFELPQNVLDVIALLSQKFGASLPQQQHSSTESKPRHHRGHHRGHKSNDDSWQHVRDFKPTVVIEKNNKTNDIRVALNKLSTKNYDTTSEFIIEKIKELDGEENREAIVPVIIDIFSTNKMFSALYAKFYKRLIEAFPEMFQPTLESLTQKFVDSLQTIRYVDQNGDYDEFCKYNKENDRRKATAIFIIHLSQIGLIPTDKILFMTQSLVALVHTYIKEENRTNEVEEITENIFLLLTTNEEMLKMVSGELRADITTISMMKIKEWPSISSRTIFKYVDIVERL